MERVKVFDLWGGQTVESKVSKKEGMDRGMGGKKGKAVLVPGGGDSINPRFVEHAELVERVGREKEVRKRRGKRLKEEVRWRVEPKDEMDGMMVVEGGGDKEESLDGEGDDNDDANDSFEKVVTRERKTRTQRNKERRKQKRKVGQLMKQREKRRNAKYKCLKEVLTQIDEQETKRQERKEKSREKQHGDSAPIFSTLAGAKVPSEADKKSATNVKDLGFTLRETAPSKKNALLKERFLSFQRRGLIIPSLASRKEAGESKRRRLGQIERPRKRRVKPRRGSRSGFVFSAKR